MKNFTLALTLLLSLVGHNASAQTDATLWESTSSAPGYRIPAITQTYDGNLMAISDIRNGGDIGSGFIYLVSRIWNGTTWGSSFTIMSANSSATGFEYSHGDAAVVTDRESNRILIMAASGDVGYGSSSTSKPLRVGRAYVNSEGTTLTAAEDITTTIYGLNSSIYKAFFSSGRICQSKLIKTGDYYRIYSALCTNLGSLVVYSDDFGSTWSLLGGSTARPASSGDEAKVEELPNGDVLLSSRCSGRYYNIFNYTDNTNWSTGSWQTVVQNSNIGTTCNGEILLVPAKDASGNILYVLLQSVPATTGREKVCIWYKALKSKADFDNSSDFSSWDGSYQVSSTTSAYSTMILAKDGSIPFLYEENSTGSYYDIVFKNLSLSTITNSAYTAYPGITDAERLAYLGESTETDGSADDAIETPVVPNAGNIYLIRNFGGYYESEDATDFTTMWDKVIYSPDDDAEDIKFLIQDYNKLVDADHDINHLALKYYWVLNETSVDGTTYYYFSNCAGTGYMGRTTGTIYGGSGGTSNNVPGITTNFSEAFLFKSLNIPVYGTNYYSSTYNSSYNRTEGTVLGYNMEFLSDTSGNTRYLDLGVDQSGSTSPENDELNWMDHGSTWYLGSKSNFYWSTAFSLEQVDYSREFTLYRHENGYTLKDGETWDYFCTLYLPFAANLDTNLQVYCIDKDKISTDNDGNTVTLTKLSLNTNDITTEDEEGNKTTTTMQVLPPNTPVLLRLDYNLVTNNSESSTTTTISSLADYTTAGVEGDDSNALTGVPVVTELTDYDWEGETSDPIYVLSRKNGRVAMYRLVGSTSGAYAKVNAFTAYYNTANNTSSTTTANANALTFVFNDINDSQTTGIQTVNTEYTVTDDAIYDLQGRRVENPARGIYIKNGKKYLVK